MDVSKFRDGWEHFRNTLRFLFLVIANLLLLSVQSACLFLYVVRVFLFVVPFPDFSLLLYAPCFFVLPVFPSSPVDYSAVTVPKVP